MFLILTYDQADKDTICLSFKQQITSDSGLYGFVQTDRAAFRLGLKDRSPTYVTDDGERRLLSLHHLIYNRKASIPS